MVEDFGGWDKEEGRCALHNCHFLFCLNHFSMLLSL